MLRYSVVYGGADGLYTAEYDVETRQHGHESQQNWHEVSHLDHSPVLSIRDNNQLAGFTADPMRTPDLMQREGQHKRRRVLRLFGRW
jgi:hypothetical protein